MVQKQESAVITCTESRVCGGAALRSLGVSPTDQRATARQLRKSRGLVPGGAVPSAVHEEDIG